MWQKAASDLCFPADQSHALLTSSPDRWDEVLDLDLPVFVLHTCGAWNEIGRALWQSGLSSKKTVRLVESNGEVKKAWLESDELHPTPATNEWTLVLNWTHPDEGWRTRLPLWGKTYLVTRQRAQGKALVGQLEALGARAACLPTIEFVPPDDERVISGALDRLESFDWLILTSPNGVRHFFARLQQSDRDQRALGKVRFACIGPGTAKELRKFGFQADVLPESFVAEGLLEALETETLKGKRVLIPRAQEAREILPETLSKRGAEVTVAPVYKTVHPKLEAAEAELVRKPTRVLFTSSSTVKNWIKLTGNRELPCLCIGPVTAGTAREEGLEILGVAEVHTIDGLLEKIKEVDGKAPLVQSTE